MSEKDFVVAIPPPPPPPPPSSALFTPDSGTAVPPKRKKGRPPKNRDLVPSSDSNLALLPKPDGRGRKPKRKYGDVVWPAVDNAFIGQQVHGVLDGSFDAGYLLTVRVENTEIVLRGAIFEPSLSLPISQSNDIAPNVKFIGRGAQVAPSQYLSENANQALPAPAVIPLDNCITMASGHTPAKEDIVISETVSAGQTQVTATQAVTWAENALVGAVPAQDALVGHSTLADTLIEPAPLSAGPTENAKGILLSSDLSAFAAREKMGLQEDTQPSQAVQSQE